MSALEQKIPEGFKQTDIGIIPDDWDVVYLNDISEKIMVGIASAATHAYRDRGIPFLRNQNILPNKLDEKDTLFISPEYEVTFQNKRLKAGDLLTARTGYPGTTCMVPEKYSGAQSFTTLITRLKTSVSNPMYVSEYMNSDAGEKFFELNQIGGGQKNVNSGILKTLPLPFPSIEEQTTIANALSDVDMLLMELEKLLVKKRAIKTATMQQLLTGKTRLPQFATYTEGEKQGQPKGTKPSELGDIPDDWDVKLMDEVTDSLSSGSTPFRGNPSFYKGANRWITSGELKYGVINDTIEKISDEAIKRANLKVHQPGTFLMAITGLEAAGTRGSCGIVGMPATTNQSCMAIYPNKKLKSSYLFHWYVYNGEELALKYCQGTKQLSYTAGLLKTIPVLVPRNTDEQTIIATNLSDMDSEIQALEQRLAKTRQIKQGMMQELLTGRTRLPFKKES